MTKDRFARSLSVFAIGLVLLMMPAKVFGHCDGMDGPVVKAAQRALAKGDINLVLIWVQANDEAEIRKVFARTLAVRKLSPEARELADLYFFETLVRIHRAGEGAPYTGLKPAGRDLGPAIPAADKAIETGASRAAGQIDHKRIRERHPRAISEGHRRKEVQCGRRKSRAGVREDVRRIRALRRGASRIRSRERRRTLRECCQAS